MSEWRVVGASVRGATHARLGAPNQDAIRWYPPSGAGLPAFLSVADGHGSPRSFRSEIGARLAVEAAEAMWHGFLTHGLDPSNLSAVKRWAEEHLPRTVVRHWIERVADDLAERPFSREELARVAAEGAERLRQVVLEPLLAYGATLLSVCVTQDFIIYFQLGDGDILVVSDTGTAQRAVPRDARLIANETTSLCSRDAWRECRVVFQPVAGSAPVLVLLSTDGYSNSFREDRGFLQVGADLQEMIRAEGFDEATHDLAAWLEETSASGSGDDITLGILCRMPAFEIPGGVVVAVESEGLVSSVQAESTEDGPRE